MPTTVEVRYEQAVYGSFPFWNRGYGVLARSAGCRPDWVAALKAACQRYGERPAGIADADALFAMRIDRGPWMIVGVFPQGCDDAGRPVRWRSMPSSSARGPTGGPVPTRSPSPTSCAATGAPRISMRPCRPAVRRSDGQMTGIPLIPGRRMLTSGSSPSSRRSRAVGGSSSSPAARSMRWPHPSGGPCRRASGAGRRLPPGPSTMPTASTWWRCPSWPASRAGPPT